MSTASRLRRRLLQAAGAALLAGAGSKAIAQAGGSLDVLIAGSRLTLRFAADWPAATRADLAAWVRSAAAAVVDYLGRFPLPQCTIWLQDVPGRGVRGGSTIADPDPELRLRIGRDSDAASLRDDWVLVHEMVHLAVPRLPRSQNWLHEGLATYVESVARARAGLSSPRRLWAELQRALPQGQPQPGDQGLDHTPTWGRTYWGGALFCLQADVRLLQASGGARGLRHALQGLLAAGGSYAVAWPLRRVLEAADRHVGGQILIELYEQMKDSATPVDMDRLWRDLGVAADGRGGVQLDDDAPLSALRRAIV